MYDKWNIIKGHSKLISTIIIVIIIKIIKVYYHKWLRSLHAHFQHIHKHMELNIGLYTNLSWENTVPIRSLKELYHVFQLCKESL